MKYRCVVVFGGLTVAIALASAPVAGQAPKAAAGNALPAKPSAQMRTAWGDPDLQGIWEGIAGVPLERPARFAGRERLTDAEYEAKYRAANNKTRLEAVRAGKVENRGFRSQANYNSVFAYSDEERLVSRRTGGIIDPPDGRLPRWTPQQIKRYEALQAATAGRGEADSWEDRALNERCIRVVDSARIPVWGLGALSQTDEGAAARTDIVMVNGSVLARTSDRRILQAPGYVVMVTGDSEYQMIPLDGRAAPGPTIRQWLGYTRGRWEGNTLVVETTNVNDQQANAGRFLPTYEQYLYPGSGATLRLIERYTRIDENNLEYRYTLEDPEVYTRPYTVLHEMVKQSDRYAIEAEMCQESSKAVGNIMAAARADELAAELFAEESATARQRRLDQLKTEWGVK